MLCTCVPAVEATDTSAPPEIAARWRSSNSSASALRCMSTAAGSYPRRPIGKSRRSIACRSKSTAGILSDVARRSLADRDLAVRSFRRADLLKVTTELAQLVAKLRRVLETQVLSGRDHLLLDLHDHPLELVFGHLLAGPALGRAAFAPARNLRLGLPELGDVRDPLDDRRRRDPVLLVVGELDLAAAVGLGDRRFHRTGLLVRIHQHGALDVARRAPDRLDQRGLP